MSTSNSVLRITKVVRKSMMSKEPLRSNYEIVDKANGHFNYYN